MELRARSWGMVNREEQRRRMVERHLRDRGIRDARVLEAMASVPREEFVPTASAYSAYDDRPLPIDQGQTISQPYIVAMMSEAALLSPTDRVLEIGAGSGYAAAVLASLAASVVTIERHEALAQTAAERLRRLGYDSVEVITGDGTLGHEPGAPYDAILITAAGPEVPKPLLQQLAVGGRLIAPVERQRGHQQLVRITQLAPGNFEEEALLGVAFVPLIGEHGHPTPE